MKIDVTQDDINEGHRKNGRCCPLSLAIARAFNSPWSVVSGTGYASVILQRRGEDLVFRLPEEACSFVRIYDLEGPQAVKPITFDLLPYP